MKTLILLLVVVLLVVSCAPAGFMNTELRITCFSYGRQIYEGVGQFQRQRGIEVFVESESGKVLILEGDCTVEILE